MRVVSGIVVTRVSTEAEYPVGGIFTVCQPGTDLPDSTWRYVKVVNTPVAVGELCSYDLTTLGKAHVRQSIAAAGPIAAIAGVAQHAIAVGSYGFIQIGGVGEMKTKGTPGSGTSLIDSDEVGESMAANDANEASIGMALDTGIDATAVTCLITLNRQ